MMGRRRAAGCDLPKNLYLDNGTYFFKRSVGGILTTINLGQDRNVAVARMPDAHASIPDGLFRRQLRAKVMARDDYACAYCGSKVGLEIDHIIPTKRGGATSIRNLVAACRKCNRSKSHDHPLAFFLRLLAEARESKK